MDCAGRVEANQWRAAPGDQDPDASTLVALAKSGDRRAIEALCTRNWRLVYRSFARFTSDPSEAEDLTQEVFLRALRALPRFEDKGVPYEAYILRIAANLARDRWRAGPDRVVPVREVPDRPDPDLGPDALAVESDQRAALMRALDCIRPDYRAVLRLRILDGRNAGEVATLTNRSPVAVRQLQVRALAALRNALDDQLGDLVAPPGRD